MFSVSVRLLYFRLSQTRWGIVALLLFFTVASAADDYATWSNWRYVYLITNSNGAVITVSTVYNFPVLLRFNPATFEGLASTSNSGADIRFAKEDGTHLPYAIERWTNYGTTNDTAEVWVLVDTIFPNDTTKLIMYWNNSGAADSSASTTVFTTSNNFRGTYHFTESSGSFDDASSASFDGSRNGNVSRVSGRIGYGQSFDGTGDYVDMGDNMNPWAGALTLSGWVKRGSTGSNQTIMAKTNGGNPSTSYGWVLIFDPGNTLHFFTSSGGTNWGDNWTFDFNSSAGISDANWHHFSCVINRSNDANCKMYIDGADVTGSNRGDISTVGNVVNTVAARIGTESDGEYGFNGSLDEPRIEFTDRSAAWVKLCYQNQRWDGTNDYFSRFSSSYWQPAVYTWDNSTGAGFTAHSNTWSTSNAYWSKTGTSLANWPGPGYAARFAGSDGNWTVTVSGTQYVDSIVFDSEGYRISGGTSLVVAKKLSGPVFGFTPPWAAGLDSAKAFDGSIATYADDNATDTGNVGIDLGSGNAQRISYIRYYPRSGLSEYLDRMNGGKFQGSNDGASWTDLYTIPSSPTLAWQTVTVSNTTSWRYLRYLGPANGHCNVAEVEFYGMGGIYISRTIDDTIATVLAGNSGIRTDGLSSGSNLVLTGTNTYAGPTEIYGGRLNIATLADGGSNSGIGSSSNSASNLLLNGGAFRYIGGTTSCDRLFTLGTEGGAVYASGSGTLTLDNTGSIAFSGSGTRTLEIGGAYAGTSVFAPVLGDGSGGATSLNKTGPTCTWTLTGANTYTGATTITEGTLSIGNGGTTGAIANSSSIAVTGTLTFDRSNDYTYSGVISGAGAIVKEGAGTVTLSGNLTHSGLTTVNDGTLRCTGTQTSNTRTHVINSGGTLSVIDRLNVGAYPAAYDADWVTLNGGTLSTGIASGQNYGANRGFTLGASGGTIEIPNTDNTNAVDIRSIITGSGALTKTGPGVLMLTGTNTFTGGVTVSNGVLRAANTAALGNSGNTITVNNGGCIDANGYNLQAYTNDITINGTVSSDTGALANYGSDQQNAIRKIALGSDASIGNNGGGRLDIGRGIGGICVTGNSHTLTKVGNNMVTLLADGSGLAGVNVNAGTLRIEDVDAVGTAEITVNSGGELDSWLGLTFAMDLTLNGGTLASVEDDAYNTIWSGDVTVSSASTLACDADNTNTLSGAITGSGSLTVTGTEGVYILSGNSNTYSGGTTVSGGTLRITNTSGSATGTGAVSVADGATLDGTGSISSTLGMSGALAPGVEGTGTLTIGNSLTFTGTGVLDIEANGTTAGSGYDQVVMSSGTLTLGSSTLSFSLGYMPSIDDAFTIIDNQGGSAVSGTFSGISQGDTIVASYGGVPFDCTVSYTGGIGNDVVVKVVKISAELYATEWPYSQVLTLNTTATGADVSGDVTDFPVLLRLNPGNFDGFPNTQPGGVDIRFALSDGTKLPYVIERWKDYDFNQDTAEIWVKLDNVYGDNKTQTFVMYWGKTDAADSSNSGAVFDTANGFVGVWHLGETGNSSADGYEDATYNAAHAQGTNLASGDEGVAVIGLGQSLENASSQYITVKSASEPKFDITGAITVSAWINLTSWTTNWQALVTKGDGAWRLHRNDGNGTLNFACTGISGINGSTTITSGWKYVSAVYDESDFYLYLNGISDATPVSASGTISTNDYDVMIGENAEATGRYFNGAMDEVRVSKTARSEHWVKLCYENQKPDQTLVMYEDYSSWGFSRNITINTSGVTTSDCIGFPLLVRLTSTNFDFNQADDDGDDIRFANADGTPLRYQIERWVKGSSVAEIWVKVDTVFANDASQYITMYWGRSGVASKSDGEAVFDTSNGFTGVWHMNQASGSASDATVNALNGTVNGGVTYSQTGNIGLANVFDGDGDYFNHGNNAILQMDAADKVTVSAWVKRTGGNVNSTAEEGIAGKFEWSAGNYREYMIVNHASNGFRFVISPDGTSTNETSLASNIIPTNGTWYYVTGVMDAGNMYIFTDGVQRNSAAKSAIYGSTNANFYIGMMDDNGSARQYFNGTIDEVRVEKTNRSADWIKLCYETQKPTPTIVTTDSADAFRPLTIRREMTGSTTDSIIIATKRWAIRFAADAGGGIDFLAADSSSTDQIDANLFYLLYNSTSSASGSGTLTLLDSSIVFARVRQDKTVDGQPFRIDYTILGSGKLYVRVSTYASSALSGGLEFRIANNATASYDNIAFGSSAATCEGVAHIDSGSGKFDLVMAPYDLWSDADGITTNSNYTGLNGSSWSAPSGARYAWEFMVDFGHTTLADSAKAYKYVSDYRSSDTLGFHAGTALLEQAWESEARGEWSFDEGTGSTVYDRTGKGHSGTISGTPVWTTGKWNSGALSLGGSDSVTVADHADFDGSYAHTMMAWIYPDAPLSSSVAILKKWSSSDVGYGLMGGPSGTIQYRMSNGGDVAELQSTTVLTPGEWYHVAAKTFIFGSEDYLALYINGELDTLRSMQLDSYFGTSDADVEIGKEFTGVIDDVRYFKKLLSDEEIRAISLRGFAPERGIYRVRADNDNTLHCRMHGNVNNRFLPVLQIDNYWATALPTYVYVDGVGLTSGSDYYAALDDNRNRLTIGFNRVITTTSAIFIDDNLADGYKRTGETRKMYWGIEGSSDEFFWVKNTGGNYFGSNTSNEWYINWQMNTASIKDGEISWMRSSVTNPYTKIDTVSGTNMIQGTDGFNSCFGSYVINYTGGFGSTTEDVNNAFTYTVEESSLVRVRLRVNERQIVDGSDSYNIVTRWTIYPFGQIFRYDSIYAQSAAPVDVWYAVFWNDSSTSTVYTDPYQLRGGIAYVYYYPDLVAAWLTMKNSSDVQPFPFDADSVTPNSIETRVGMDFNQATGSPAKWNSSSVETATFFNVHTGVNEAAIDSISNGVQYIQFSGRRALSMVTGTLDSTTAGDLDEDGFAEQEGAYIVGASNNTVSFILPAHGDTCRYYPAFRITGYTATASPQYVFLYQADDTTALLEGYQYNAYVNRSDNELLLQIDSTFCDSVGIYISADKTLAVKMSNFEARPGNRCDTIIWRTESEHENLGYRIERRIQPEFFDSVYLAYEAADTSGTLDTDASGVARLVKRRFISAADTGWSTITKELIPGAPSGVSHGPRDYEFIDRDVYNGLLYEYRLIAVDYHDAEETHGPVSAMPRKLAPGWFMLGPNYPNPFRYTTRIWFALPVESAVSLNIYTLQGRLVKRLIRPDHKLRADNHQVFWDGSGDNGIRCAAGPYVYRLTTGRYVKARVMLMVR